MARLGLLISCLCSLERNREEEYSHCLRVKCAFSAQFTQPQLALNEQNCVRSFTVLRWRRPTAINHWINLPSNENVLSTTRPGWLSALHARHTEWNIFISTLYSLSDCTVKSAIVSVWGPNYLSTKERQDVEPELGFSGKWESDTQLTTPQHLLVLECWVRAFTVIRSSIHPNSINRCN